MARRSRNRISNRILVMGGQNKGNGVVGGLNLGRGQPFIMYHKIQGGQSQVL